MERKQLGSLLEEIGDDILACKLCHQRFTEPRILPCLHSFCTTCLTELIAISSKPASNNVKDNKKICQKTDETRLFRKPCMSMNIEQLKEKISTNGSLSTTLVDRQPDSASRQSESLKEQAIEDSKTSINNATATTTRPGFALATNRKKNKTTKAQLTGMTTTPLATTTATTRSSFGAIPPSFASISNRNNKAVSSNKLKNQKQENISPVTNTTAAELSLGAPATIPTHKPQTEGKLTSINDTSNARKKDSSIPPSHNKILAEKVEAEAKHFSADVNSRTPKQQNSRTIGTSFEISAMFRHTQKQEIPKTTVTTGLSFKTPAMFGNTPKQERAKTTVTTGLSFVTSAAFGHTPEQENIKTTRSSFETPAAFGHAPKQENAKTTATTGLSLERPAAFGHTPKQGNTKITATAGLSFGTPTAFEIGIKQGNVKMINSSDTLLDNQHQGNVTTGTNTAVGGFSFGTPAPIQTHKSQTEGKLTSINDASKNTGVKDSSPQPSRNEILAEKIEAATKLFSVDVDSRTPTVLAPDPKQGKVKTTATTGLSLRTAPMFAPIPKQENTKPTALTFLTSVEFAPASKKENAKTIATTGSSLETPAVFRHSPKQENTKTIAATTGLSFGTSPMFAPTPKQENAKTKTTIGLSFGTPALLREPSQQGFKFTLENIDKKPVLSFGPSAMLLPHKDSLKSPSLFRFTAVQKKSKQNNQKFPHTEKTTIRPMARHFYESKRQSRNGLKSWGQFQCPICCCHIEKPIGGVQTYPINFLLESAVTKTRRHLNCDICSHGKSLTVIAESKCLQCGDLLCDNCAKCHNLTKFTNDHLVVPLKDIFEGHTADAVKTDVNPKWPLYCTQHYQQQDDYCMQCKTLICPVCKDISHANHKHKSLNTARDDVKLELRSSLDIVNSVLELCEATAKIVDVKENVLENSAVRIRHEIDQSISEWEEKVAAAGKRLRSEFNEKYGQAKKSLSRMKAINETHTERLRKLQEEIDAITASESSNPHEILGIEERIGERLVDTARADKDFLETVDCNINFSRLIVMPWLGQVSVPLVWPGPYQSRYKDGGWKTPESISETLSDRRDQKTNVCGNHPTTSSSQ